MRIRVLSVILCLCMAASILTVAAMAATPFTDVADGDYFATPVEWAVAQGITNGTSATTFSPNDTCTRAQILTFLWRAAGSPEPQSRVSLFIDVDDSQYYAKAANWALEKDILVDNNINFEPNTPCTRLSTVEYMWRYAGGPDAAAVAFSDVSGNDTSAKAVYWAVGYGVTNGTSATTFSPNDTCTRGQIATFLHRYFVEPLKTEQAAVGGTGTGDIVLPGQTIEAPAVSEQPGAGASGTGSAASSADIPASELDPLPPRDVTRQPEWYGSLTDRKTMSNARLMAEYWNLEDLIKSDDSYRTEPVLIRESDLELEIDRRLRIVESYEEYSSESWREKYEELVAQYGDPAPLKEWYNGRG